MSPLKFYSIHGIMKANEDAGKYFFAKDTMRFFKSKVLPEIWEGRDYIFFVTSEQGPTEQDKHRYSVRRFNKETADIRTEGTFQAYETPREAKKAAENAAKLDQEDSQGEEEKEV
jgi:hypothetical protein